MTIYSRREVLSFAIATTALYAIQAESSHADEYPSQTITITVPFAAGGSADLVARIAGQKVSAALGKPVIIENRAGAGGSIAAGVIARAKPDGYNLLLVTAGHAGLSAFYPSLQFDPLKDFEPVIQLTSSPIAIIVNAESNFKTIQDLVAEIRARPGKLFFAAGGGGPTITNVAAQLFKSGLNLKVDEIPYKGSAPALTAVLANEVQYDCDALSSALAYVKGGQMRALAVTTKTRSEFLPDVPTVSETLIPGFEANVWAGILAPKGTPADIIDRLNKEFNAALAAPDVREKLKVIASTPEGGSKEQFGKLLESETDKWGAAIKKIGLKAE